MKVKEAPIVLIAANNGSIRIGNKIRTAAALAAAFIVLGMAGRTASAQIDWPKNDAVNGSSRRETGCTNRSYRSICRLIEGSESVLGLANLALTHQPIPPSGLK